VDFDKKNKTGGTNTTHGGMPHLPGKSDIPGFGGGGAKKDSSEGNSTDGTSGNSTDGASGNSTDGAAGFMKKGKLG